MKNKLNAEAHVLDRILYLLEEGSVTYLMKEDTTFADYVDNLYKNINTKATLLRNF